MDGVNLFFFFLSVNTDYPINRAGHNPEAREKNGRRSGSRTLCKNVAAFFVCFSEES